MTSFKLPRNDSTSEEGSPKVWEGDSDAGSSEDIPPSSPWMTENKHFYGEAAGEEEEEEDDNDKPQAKRHKGSSSREDSN